MKWFHKKAACESALPVLSTERLVLRAFEPSDAVSVYAYAQSEKVAQMAGFAPHKSLEESREMVVSFMEKRSHWAIVEKATGHLIGSIHLQMDYMRPHVENALRMGYMLSENCWGQGYATEACREMLRYAFEEQSCPVVSADLFPQNTKSRRVLKKLGFAADGILRHARLLPDGTPTDLVNYSLLRAEYEALKNKTK